VPGKFLLGESEPTQFVGVRSAFLLLQGEPRPSAAREHVKNRVDRC
jgi:hypothetical protein